MKNKDNKRTGMMKWVFLTGLFMLGSVALLSLTPSDEEEVEEVEEILEEVEEVEKVEEIEEEEEEEEEEEQEEEEEEIKDKVKGEIVDEEIGG